MIFKERTTSTRTRPRAAIVAPALLVAVLLSVKTMVFLLAGMPTPGFAPAQLFRMQALDNHFLEYLFYNIEKPPLCMIFDWALVKAFGIDRLLHSSVGIYVTSLISICAAVLIYSAARQLRAPIWAGASAALIFGIGIIPFDYWRPAIHYDHYTIGLAALFVFCLSRFVIAPSRKSALLLGVSAAIYALQSSITMVVAPASILAAGLMVWSCGVSAMRRLAPRLLLAIALPLSASGAVAVKNQFAWGVSAPATNGGAANMMMAWRVAGDTRDPSALDQAMIAINAPDWYRWCYNNPISPIDTKTGLPIPGWDFIAKTHGFCFVLNNFESVAWPTDFEPLLSYLRKTKSDPGLLASIEKQVEIIRDRTYLFSGYNPENALPFVATYGTISSKVFLELIRAHPSTYLISLHSNWSLMLRDGPDGPAWMLRTSRLLKASAPVIQSLGWATKLWEHASRLAFWLALVMIAFATVLSVCNLVRGAIRRRIEPLPDWMTLNVQGAVGLAMPGILVLAVFVSVSSGEFSRLHLQASPSLFVALAFVPVFVVPMVRWARAATAAWRHSTS